MTPTREDHELAARVAERAGEILVALRAEYAAGEFDQRTLKAAGDRTSHDFLMDALRERLAAGDGVLSEEDDGSAGHVGSERVWIIDPLDGTREFSEPPRTDWAVHVGLAIAGEAVCGAVALPALGMTLSTAKPVAAPQLPVPSRPRIVVSRTRSPAAATYLAEQLHADLIEMGSAGAKAMAVVHGEADIYVHSGGQYQWDSCAPVAVAAAAGLHCSRIDGSPLRYDGTDPYLPDLLICRPELAAQTLEVLASFVP